MFKKRRNYSSQRPQRSAHGTHHGPWWGMHGRAPLHSRVLSFSARLFLFPCDFLVGTDVLALKEACTWPIWGVEFIVYSLSHSKNIIEEEEGRRRGIKRKATYCRWIKRSTSKHSISSLLFFFLSTSSFCLEFLVWFVSLKYEWVVSFNLGIAKPNNGLIVTVLDL